MSHEFQKLYKTVDAYSIVLHLRELYNVQARTKRVKVSKLFSGSKMEERTSPMQHALKIYEYIESLNQLGYWMDFELSIDLILASLPNSFANFVLDYRMNYIMSTIPDLMNLRKITDGKLAEKEGQSDCPKRDLPLLWSSLPLEEKLQGLLRVQEGGGM